jgi:hemerythrin
MAVVDLSVGHPELDAQHHAMVHLVSDVHRAIGAGDVEATRSSLEALWHGTVSHFASEDALMEEYSYPERNPHRTAHQLFLEDLKALVRAVQEDGLTAESVSWALHRVPEWISFHVETNDAPLARYIARKTAARMVAGARGEAPDKKPPRRDA